MDSCGRKVCSILVAMLLTVGLFNSVYAQEENETQEEMSIDDILDNADEYYDNKDYKNAAVYYEKAVKMEPEDEVLFYNLGMCYSNLEKNRSALMAFQKYLELYPEAEDRDEIVEKMNKFKKNLNPVKPAVEDYKKKGYICYDLDGITTPSFFKRITFKQAMDRYRKCAEQNELKSLEACGTPVLNAFMGNLKYKEKYLINEFCIKLLSKPNQKKEIGPFDISKKAEPISMDIVFIINKYFQIYNRKEVRIYSIEITDGLGISKEKEITEYGTKYEKVCRPCMGNTYAGCQMCENKTVSVPYKKKVEEDASSVEVKVAGDKRLFPVKKISELNKIQDILKGFGLEGVEYPQVPEK